MEKFPNAMASRNCQVGWAEGIQFHAVAIEKNVITDKQRLLEDVKSESGSMAIDVEGFDTVVIEFLVEKVVKAKRMADFMARICLVNANLGAKMLAVKVGCAEKMVMGKQDGVDWRQ